jgi:UDP-N-acetylglucosamine 2-epimerase (non-hydrolysing)/GDP/UDP-N,N'-diacetylbacillosamine 2-epimerase (hydrolysing)
MSRRIAVFTGNRAEYGLQRPIISAIKNHPNLDYQLIVSGAHLDTNFGNTLAEIVQDGFEIAVEVQIEMDGSALNGTATAIGTGVIAIGEALQQLKPDMLVVYADRFEGFAAVVAGSQMNIPVAHIEGGDLTEGGALDDSIRHAMTKLSHLHFTTNLQATNRVLGMGEEAWRVFTVGLPSNDLIKNGEYATREEVFERLTLTAERPIVIFTQHSVTTEFDQAGAQVVPSLDALSRLADEGVQVIVTYPNNDAGSDQIIDRIRAVSHANIQVRPSLGRHLYHGVLGLALDRSLRVACAGNSSSGIKETPMFGCPTVNVGSRQQGRLRGDNVLTVDYSSEEIYSAIHRCLFDGPFREECFKTSSPYYMEGSASRIAEVLASIPLDRKLLQKTMTLQGEEQNGWHR